MATEPGQHPDLGRGLVGRSRQADVDAFAELDVLGDRGRVQTPPEARAPGIGQVREARAELVGVGPDQRAAPGQVDVVGHHHERAGAERGIQTAGRVREHDDPGAQGVEQQHGLDDEPRVVAFVQVEAALEHDHGPATQTAEQQPPDMARRGRSRPTGQLREGDGHGVGQVVSEAAEPGAQHDPDLGHEWRALAHGRQERGDAGGLLGGRDRTRGIHGHGRVGSDTDLGASRVRSSIGRPRLRDFVRPTEVSTPGCRSHPAGRLVPRSGRGETARGRG